MSDNELAENAKTSDGESIDNLPRLTYSEPNLTLLGTVRDLTQSGIGSGAEGGSGRAGMN